MREMVRQIETEYCRFMDTHRELEDFSGVEYLGLNLSGRERMETVFKIYHTTAESSRTDIPILRPLRQRNMVRALNRIEDTVNGGKLRLEIGLANRTDENMRWLYRWLCEMYPGLGDKREDLNKLSELKCCELPGFQYAAMYFLGMILSAAPDGRTMADAVKLHYLLRDCEDPDKPGKNYTVHQDACLETLRNTGIKAFIQLYVVMEKLLGRVSAELWMAAVDYYRSGSEKYKIYLKEYQSDIYERLAEILRERGECGLAEIVLAYAEWVGQHKELEQYGLAVCLTGAGQWSVNFYH